VDAERFLRELPGLFDDFPGSETPRDPMFADLLERVSGIAKPNNLALLNLAARCLEPGESYVEVGTYHGTSLIAALLGNDADVVGIDNFSLGDGTRRTLERNLEGYGLAGRPTIVEGDAFELVPGGALDGRRVGVYYYDNGHAYEQQLEGLRMVEPWLAERALLIVDDSDWERVARATRDYLAAQPRARLALEIDGKDRGQPWWWEGMQLLTWR
jgi:predicted O-methyltransferase YrrM